jgi:hypothetical protein
MIIDDAYIYNDSSTTADTGFLLNEEQKIAKYFEQEFNFHPTKNQNIIKGDYAEGTLDKFFVRFQEKINQDRLSFLFGSAAKTSTFENTLQNFLGYLPDKNSNVTVIDLSGVPFEVLSITPSLKQGEALLVGESIILPSIVQIDRCTPEPSSNDIPYWELWKDEWKEMDINKIKDEWHK